MDRKKRERLKRRESLIVIAFTIFSVFLAYVSTTLGWTALFIPLMFGEVGFAWWAYLTDFQDYVSRAIIITIFASVSIFFYGSYGEHFDNLIPTLCVFSVLFGIYQLRPIVDITLATQLALLLYHIFVKHTFVIPDRGTLEFDRIALQLLSLVVLDMLCLYSTTRSRELEDEIDSLGIEMSRTQKTKDDFVANTSHELRTPINTISGMSEILLQENLPERAHASALDIQMTGIELNSIVTDILDYAALESDVLQLSPRNYNITSTINDVMNMTVFQNRDKNLEIVFDCDPRIPCLMYGDEYQLRRVMNNLISNAIKFTNEGGVMVSVTFRKEDYGVNLMVSVKDTGIGMSRENIEHIFQDFYQADADRNRGVEGMGLGLTISSRLINKMGGFLTVHSQLGVGSEFSFSLPQQVVDSRACIALSHPEQVATMWYVNQEAADSRMRDSRILNINRISERLEIPIHLANSLPELKRRIQQSTYTHLFVGLTEYNEDPLYFNELGTRLLVVLVLERTEDAPKNARVHVLYRPFNAMTLAELFNGGDILTRPTKYSEIRPFEAPSAKILVVDDNIMNLKVVEGLLRRYRIKITAASSGEEALAQVESQDYDFIFMDHMMPNMDGIECFHRIRSKSGEYYSQGPIIALTANAIAGSREMFLQEGFNEFVAKPIDNSLLHQILEDFIPDYKKNYIDEMLEQNPTDEPAEKDPFDMEGIDMALALGYCGDDINNFVDLARIFCESAPKTLADIEKYHEQKDWENYAILVHALKSTSKTLGAVGLSDLAWTEEQAGKAADVEKIENNHEALINEYKRVIELFESNPKIYEQEETEPAGAGTQLKDGSTAGADETNPRLDGLTEISAEQFDDVVVKLSQLLDTFESDKVQSFIEEQSSVSFDGHPLSELFAPVIRAVDNFDFAGALSELHEVVGDVR